MLCAEYVTKFVDRWFKKAPKHPYIVVKCSLTDFMQFCDSYCEKNKRVAKSRVHCMKYNPLLTSRACTDELELTFWLQDFIFFQIHFTEKR